jgi:hypothetical protein
LDYFSKITGMKGGEICRSVRELPIMTITMRALRTTGDYPNGG